jgi:hypothetical protein
MYKGPTSCLGCRAGKSGKTEFLLGGARQCERGNVVPDLFVFMKSTPFSERNKYYFGLIDGKSCSLAVVRIGAAMR